MDVASFFIALFEAYVVFGLLLGAAFVIRGVGSIDPAARGTGVGFRLVILPGVIALWPVMVWRWMRSR